MRDPGPHELIVVEGEIEVCRGCVNDLGYNVAWDQAHPAPLRPGPGAYWGNGLGPSGERLI